MYTAPAATEEELTSLTAAMASEKEVREKAELEAVREKELRSQAETEVREERERRQAVEGEREEEKEARGRVEGEVVKERELRQQAEASTQREIEKRMELERRVTEVHTSFHNSPIQHIFSQSTSFSLVYTGCHTLHLCSSCLHARLYIHLPFNC